jgi:hypothetical protein
MILRYVPESFADYHNHLMWVMSYSPDLFTSFDDEPVDQPAALRQSFDVLIEAFPFIENKLKDPYLAAILRELIHMSYEFFATGDDDNGIYVLQEVEGTVWPSRRVPSRHSPAAEQRAHGKLERYAGVIPNPYPYTGTINNMGPAQRHLYEQVRMIYEQGIETLKVGQTHHWLLGLDHVARRFHERTQKATNDRFIRELAERSTTAALRVKDVSGDLLIHDVEQPGRTRVSVRGSMEQYKDGKPNFLIEAPQWTALVPVALG